MARHTSAQANAAATSGGISNRVFIALFAVALALLAFSAGGSAYAALTQYSDIYQAQVTMPTIGVAIVENGEEVAWRNYSSDENAWQESSAALLGNVVAEGEDLKVGVKYDDSITVRNTGNIDQYVRVRLSKYWVGEDGTTRLTNLDPELIGLEVGGEDWLVDEDASTPERTVLYYTDILPVGEDTSAFVNSLTINNALATKVTETTETNDEGFTTITTNYDYDGVSFVVKAEVDAVQTHNAEDAIKSAWGKTVTVADDGTLSL